MRASLKRDGSPRWGNKIRKVIYSRSIASEEPPARLEGLLAAATNDPDGSISACTVYTSLSMRRERIERRRKQVTSWHWNPSHARARDAYWDPLIDYHPIHSPPRQLR